MFKWPVQVYNDREKPFYSNKGERIQINFTRNVQNLDEKFAMFLATSIEDQDKWKDLSACGKMVP